MPGTGTPALIIVDVKSRHNNTRAARARPHATCKWLNYYEFFMPLINILPVTLGTVMALMLAAWLVSVQKGKACLADSFWGPGFILVAWVTCLVGPGTPRSYLTAVLITLWGFRLALHISLRNWEKPEDRRYQSMRDHHGPKFWWISLFSVFLLQGFILWVISLAPQIAQASPQPAALTWLDAVGILIWTAGMTIESVADYQMQKFRNNPDNREKVMDRRLWAWTRHPNYFGESLIWWGIFCMALAVPGGWITIISPLLITFLLLKVSGVAMLEKDIGSRRPGYEEYKNRVNAFFPWFPSKKQPSSKQN